MLDWFWANQLFIDDTLITALVVMSFFVVLQAGVFSLASVGFMAVGGYTSAVLTADHGMPAEVGILAGTVAAGLLAAIFGLGVLRLSGIYLALGTFALGQATIIIIGELGVTHGQEGILGIPLIYSTWWAVGALAVFGAAWEVMRRSHHGRAFNAIRLDEVVARGMGIDAGRYRLVALVLSGLLAGFAGGLNAHEIGVISPDQYSFSLLVLALTYAMVGGFSHWSGPLAAAIVLGVLREQLRGVGTDVEDLAYGVLLVLIVFVAPRGLGDRRILGAVRWLWSAVTRRPAGPAGGATPRPEPEGADATPVNRTAALAVEDRS